MPKIPDPMDLIRPRIQHVVVLMMENRSFDHLLGDLPGVDGASPEHFNLSRKNGKTYSQDRNAADYAEHEDPTHEFNNAVQQLGGTADPDMSGFVDQHETAYPQASPQIVMNTCGPDLVPAIPTLAANFAVSDHWFCSLPGPTWPNRFFAMMGSCHGSISMEAENAKLDAVSKTLQFYFKESIFSLLGSAAQIYSQESQTAAQMVNGTGFSATPLSEFDQAVATDTLPQLSWVEPNHRSGEINNQHPAQDVRLGDNFIARIYNTLRKSPEVFAKTLFVVTYDEHGGFYDHVAPPRCVAPDDSSADEIDPATGKPFDFCRLGPRVPTLLISLWIKPGRVLDASGEAPVYDHTSLLAFLCDLFGKKRKKLGLRVEAAQHFGNADIWLTQARRDLPELSPSPAKRNLKAIEQEAGFASELRRLIQAQHAYLFGGDVAAAQRDLAGPGRDARNLPHSQQRLDEMALEIKQVMASLEKSQAQRGLAPAAKDKLRILCLERPEQAADKLAFFSKHLGLPESSLELKFQPAAELIDAPDDPLQSFRRIRGRHLFGGKDALTANDEAQLAPAVLWLEDEELRQQANRLLLEEIRDFRPALILAGELSSLIAYDALRQALVKTGRGKDPLRLKIDSATRSAIDGICLVTHDSLLGHHAVIRTLGSALRPLRQAQRGLRTWFHLHNSSSGLVRPPLPGYDADRCQIELAGSAVGEALSHPASLAQLWPQLRTLLTGAAPSLAALPPCLSRRRKRALLVGINLYPEASMQLNGCVNDVFLISQTLQQNGYEASDIRILLDDRATRDEILSRLQWLVEGAGPGDERVFYYSGHGAQLPVYGESGEPDRLDETLVPWDFNWDRPETHITDKEFRQFYSRLPFGDEPAGSAQLSIILDCCHAGGMTRGAGRIRGINPPHDIRHRMMRWDEPSRSWQGRPYARIYEQREFTGDTNKSPNPYRSRQGQSADCRILDRQERHRLERRYGHQGPYMPRLLYAAAESQLASEYDHGALSYGAFTFTLVETLNAMKAEKLPSPDFPTLMSRIDESLRLRQFTQTPQLVGPAALRQGRVPWI